MQTNPVSESSLTVQLSIVTTLYYSAPYVAEFYERISRVAQSLTPNYEIVFVNDGSPDNAAELVIGLHQKDPKVVLVDLARNFGHHKAMMTGLRFAQGQHVFLIDVDLEEEPELLTEFWETWQAEPDLEVVYGIMEKRKGGFWERLNGRLFYNFFASISDINYPPDTLVARLMTRKYVDSTLLYPEKELELWGVFALLGFKQKGIKVKKGHKGSTTYNFSRKLKLALESITSFSSKPLFFIFLLGSCITFVSLLLAVWVVIQKATGNIGVDGWTTLIVSVWLIGGLLMFCLGIIGIYLSKMFNEVKNRPLVIIKDIYKHQNNE